MRSPVRLAVATLMLSIAMLGTAPPSDAQPVGPRGLEIAVLALDGVLTGPESLLRVQLAVRNPGPRAADGLQVTAALYQRMSSRFAFRQAMDDGQVAGSQAGQITSQLEPAILSPLPAGSSQTVELQATARELRIDQPAQQGVYPLRITLQRRGLELARVTTSVVAVVTHVDNPLRMALLIPIDHAPGLLADGSYDQRLPRALTPGGVLDRIARELEAEARFPLTLAPSGYLLEQVTDLTDGYQASSGANEVIAGEPSTHDAAAFLARLRDITSRAGVEELALAYGPADLVALVRAGLGKEARRELSEGTGAVERAIGQQVLRGVLLPAGGLDRATMRIARAEAVDTVVLDEESVRVEGERPPSTTPSPVRYLDSGETVLVPDPLLDDVLSRPASDDDHVLAAQRVIAETAAVYFERPFASDPRGVLVQTPRQWDPPAGFLAQLLARTRSAPWLRPVDLSGLQRDVKASQEVALAYPSHLRRRELGSRYLANLADSHASLWSLAAVLDPGDPTVGRFDRMLLAAAAVWYRDGLFPAEGAARITLVRQTAERIYDAVRVVEDNPVTLTSTDEQQVPVTVVSEAGLPLRVRVRLEATPITFEQGNTQIVDLEPGLATTLVFPVRVLTPGGTFAANVFVEDPSGDRRLAQGSIQVRSATYSIVALVVTAGAGLFLVAWWVREVIRQRGNH